MWHIAGVAGFSRRPDDVAAARRFLIDAAANASGGLPTYGEVATIYGGIARAVGPVLNSIRRDCDQAGEPDLTALVVDKKTKLPGSFAGRPVEPGTAAEVEWRAELERIRKHQW